MNQYDHAVYIGRFQPFHKSHWETIKRALSIAKNVHVVVGYERGSGRTVKNPFLPNEIEDMILSCNYGILPSAVNDRLHIHKCPNDPDDSVWVQNVKSLVPDGKTALIGFKKDASSYYLNLFPEWEFVSTEGHDTTLNATDIRAAIFKDQFHTVKKDLCLTVYNLIEQKLLSPLRFLKEDYSYYESYKDSWSKSPYTPVFVTADAIVKWGHKTLWIKRGKVPGRGNLAFPRGFVEANETVLDGCLRELKEETGLILDKSLVMGTFLADNPNRSLRGRVISHVFVFDITSQPDVLGNLKESTDEGCCFWVDISDTQDNVDPHDPYALTFFEDHLSILTHISKEWT